MIIVGTFVFLLTGALIGEVSHEAGAGIVPGLLLGVLAAIPIQSRMKGTREVSPPTIARIQRSHENRIRKNSRHP